MNEEEYFKKFSTAILNFTNLYLEEIVFKIIERQDYVEEPKRFFYTLIHKTVSTLGSSNIFIRNFEINSHFNTSLFILLRSAMSDIILAEYVIIKGKTDKDQAELILRIYFDHIENIIKSLNKSAKKAYGWNDEEALEKINQIKESKKQYFNSDGSPKMKSIRTSPFTLISNIFSGISTPLARDYDLLRRSYDLYSQFSKFEHFGDLTFSLIHRAYKEDPQKTVLYDLYDGVRIICFALTNYISLWDSIPGSTQYQIQELNKAVNQFHPKILNSSYRN